MNILKVFKVMCGRYVITSPVSKTNRLVKSAIQVEESLSKTSCH